MKLNRVVNVSLITLLFTGAIQSLAATTQPVAEYKIEATPHILSIPVQIEGNDACFLVDTGYSNCVLDSKVFPNLHSRKAAINVGTPNGLRPFELFDAPDMQIGPFHLRASDFVNSFDLKMLDAATDRRIFGIVGMDQLSKFVVQIDFDNHCLRFFTPDDASHPEWGEVVAMKLNKGVPEVTLEIDHTPQRLLIDTGSRGALQLSSELYEKTRRLNDIPQALSYAVTAGGTATNRLMRIPELSLFGMKYHNLIVEESKEPMCLLGLSLLSRHLVTIDAAHLKLYLKPGKDFDRRDEADMSGLHILRLDSKTVAAVVDDASPAYEAGMRSGDILTSVEGKPAGEYEIEELRSLLKSENGKEIKLSFKHDSDDRTVKFKLKRKI